MTTDLATAWSSLQMQLDAHRPDGDADVAGPGVGVATPVVLVTGFLGAGKSFLLAHLLATAPDGLAIKAIVNDVGSLPFDPTLVADNDDVRVELTNGCACCERAGDLAATLDELVRDEGCDLVVLEASGAADPLGLAQVVAAQSEAVLDRIVTVVDLGRVLQGFGEGPGARLVERQLDASHCVVVSHCDGVDGGLVDAGVVDAALGRLAERVPGRTVMTSSLDAPASEVLLPTSPRGARPGPQGPQMSHQEFVVLTVEAADQRSEAQVRELLEGARPELVRAKGRVPIDGRAHVVQLTPAGTEICADAGAGPGGITIITTDRAVGDRLAAALRDPVEATRPR